MNVKHCYSIHLFPNRSESMTPESSVWGLCAVGDPAASMQPDLLAVAPQLVS